MEFLYSHKLESQVHVVSLQLLLAICMKRTIDFHKATVDLLEIQRQHFFGMIEGI